MAEITKKPENNSRPRNFNGNANGQAVEQKQFEEVVINVDRVSRVVKGGRRFRFKALVVVGDGKNKVGVGVAKGADVQAAVAKATNVAKKHLITVSIDHETIPHDVEIRATGAQVLLKPAAPGTGIIAGGVVRSVIAVTGIKNLISKSLGSTNKVNIAYATVEALRTLVPKSEWINRPTKSVAKKAEVSKEEVKVVAEVAKKPKAVKAPAKKTLEKK